MALGGLINQLQRNVGMHIPLGDTDSIGACHLTMLGGPLSGTFTLGAGCPNYSGTAVDKIGLEIIYSLEVLGHLYLGLLVYKDSCNRGWK
eukprot:15366027-Ditylum_brightwellii.AAC.2